MSVNGYWDAAFEAAFSEKSEALTRTLQWIVGDRIRISGDYKVVYRKQGTATGAQREVDFLATNVICTTAYIANNKLHVEIQAHSAAGMMKRMLGYGVDLSVVTQKQRQLSFPLQAVVALEASAYGKQSRRKLETELVDAFGERFGKYTVPVVYLSESCQDTLFEPVFFSETNNLNNQSDMALWSQSVDKVSRGLRSDIAARYADNLLKASQKRYHLREEFATMTNEERLRKYKDIPSPTKKARAEGRAEERDELAESLQRLGVSQDTIRLAIEDVDRRRAGYTEPSVNGKGHSGPDKIDLSGM